jgi:hypothetical protein
MPKLLNGGENFSEILGEKLGELLNLLNKNRRNHINKKAEESEKTR